MIMLTLVILALITQGLFAGYETGFVSLNPIRIRYRAQEEKDPRAAHLLRFMSNPYQMVTTLLVGTNLGTVAGAVAVSALVPDDWFVPEALLSAAVVAPTFLLFAEIVPKSIFRAHPNRLALALFPVIRLSYWLFWPIAAPLTWVTQGLLAVVGKGDRPFSALMYSLEDVKHLVDESASHGAIEADEQRMIHSVIGLQERQAKDIMTPRVDIKAAPEDISRDELLPMFAESGFSRLPIYRGTVDNIVGIVNVYDVMLEADASASDIRRFVREVAHVPDTMSVGVLFQRMKDERAHMMIVTDEYGCTDGLVTLEDILEEIFGEILDEHDREEASVQRVGENAYVVDARVTLEELSAAIGLPVVDEEVETVGGWTLRVMGHIPVQGEVAEAGRFRVTALEAEAHTVTKIRLDILREQ